MYGGLLQFVRLKKGTVYSCSALADFQHVYVRNMFSFCFALSMARQFFGENIICHTMRQHISETYVNTHCYINGTFTPSENTTRYHDYYQWVPIMFLLLAVSYHLPLSFWFKRNRRFVQEITEKVDDADQSLRVIQVVNVSKGNGLFGKTCCLEASYAVLLTLQIVVLHFFFHGFALPKVLFPETGHCHLDFYSGGDLTKGKFICLLPLNIVYSKLFWPVVAIMIGLIVWNVLNVVRRIWMYFEFGRRIDEWWCLLIAAENAKTFDAKCILEQEMKRLRSKEGEKSEFVLQETTTL